MRIEPLQTAVDDATYRAVLSICGEETAQMLEYSDPQELEELNRVIDLILNGVKMARGGNP